MDTQGVEIKIRGEEEIAALRPCLKALEIEHRAAEGNGTGPQLVVIIRPDDDARLLFVTDALIDLRARYLEQRQRARVEQLTFLEGSEEVVVL